MVAKKQTQTSSTAVAPSATAAVAHAQLKVRRDVNKPTGAKVAGRAATAKGKGALAAAAVATAVSDVASTATASTVSSTPVVVRGVHCNGCGKTANADAVECSKCNHVFHTRCFRPQHFVGNAKDGTSTRCLNCESGSYHNDLLINVKRHKTGNPVEVAARELLTRGFAVADIGLGHEATMALLTTARERITAHFTGLMHAYESQLMSGASVPTLETGYTNFRARGAGRYEVIAPEITKPLFDEMCGPGTLLRAMIDLILPPLQSPAGSLGPLTDVVEFASGIIYSTSGASGQNWHTDGPAVSSVAEATLPYAVNIFIPLIDVGPLNGTQFVDGSHCPLFGGDNATARVIPEVSVGQAMFFDYRVLHRGLPNHGSLARPCMYITFARRWYQGDMNFSQRRYRGHLEPFHVGTATRRRADH